MLYLFCVHLSVFAADPKEQKVRKYLHFFVAEMYIPKYNKENLIQKESLTQMADIFYITPPPPPPKFSVFISHFSLFNASFA